MVKLCCYMSKYLVSWHIMQRMKIVFSIKKYIQSKIEMSLLRNKIVGCFSTHSYSICTHSKKKKCLSEIFC